jgi:ankyrin repeat protein
LDLNFNAIDNKGNTALHLSTKNGNTKMIYKILLKGQDYNQKNEKGESPFSIAKNYNYDNILALFVRY